MVQQTKVRRLHCDNCNVTFRQQIPPRDDPTYERVKCSDCDHSIDTWDENGKAVVSKGPPYDMSNVWSNVGEWVERQAELYGECLDCDPEEYFRP